MRCATRGATALCGSTRPGAVRLGANPKEPTSSCAETGLYVYDHRVLEIAAALDPSARGERETLDVNRAYLEWCEFVVERLGRGFAWLDTGPCDSLLEAAEFLRTIQQRQSTAIGCLEEIAYRQGWIGFGGADEENLRA